MSATTATIDDCRERALLLPCEGETLLGILSLPAAERPAPVLGVLIVVGGPQYRAGSHRQFTLLARRLAAAGFPALRFDYRGMGDSSGAARDFMDVTPDIDAGLQALQAEAGVPRCVVLGLCDAASAALMHWEQRRDPRVAALALLNPWTRSAASLARTQVKHYYLDRLRQREFWLKLLRGGVALQALRGLLGNLRQARQGSGAAAAVSGSSYQQRMARGWRDFPGPLLLLLSGRDYTAKEFLDNSANDPAWQGLLRLDKVRRVDLAEADHTFSDRAEQARAETAVLQWLAELRP